MSSWPTKQTNEQTNCEHYFDSPNNQTNWTKLNRTKLNQDNLKNQNERNQTNQDKLNQSNQDKDKQTNEQTYCEHYSDSLCIWNHFILPNSLYST